MKEIIDVVVQATKAIANLLVFMLVAYIVAGIFFMQLLSGEMESTRDNFDCFGQASHPHPIPTHSPRAFPLQALRTLFIVMSGENWNSVPRPSPPVPRC